jgi:hypothetical protein
MRLITPLRLTPEQEHDGTDHLDPPDRRHAGARGELVARRVAA